MRIDSYDPPNKEKRRTFACLFIGFKIYSLLARRLLCRRNNRSFRKPYAPLSACGNEGTPSAEEPTPYIARNGCSFFSSIVFPWVLPFESTSFLVFCLNGMRVSRTRPRTESCSATQTSPHRGSLRPKRFFRYGRRSPRRPRRWVRTERSLLP